MAVALATSTDWMLSIALPLIQQRSHAGPPTQYRLNRSRNLTFDFWDRQLWQAVVTRRRFRVGRAGSGSGAILGAPGAFDRSDPDIS